MYPEDLKKNGIEVDIAGVILDYMAQSGDSFSTILSAYPSLYNSLFLSNGFTKHQANMLVKAAVNDPEQLQILKKQAAREIWKELTEIIAKIESEQAKRTVIRENNLPDKLANHRVDGVVWQLSDIHFGSQNSLGLDAKQLADRLANIVKLNYTLQPRIIIVSGDVSTRANESELQEFVEFCKDLGSKIWDKHYPYRFLVVPGNHDITWGKEGKTDKLNNFNKYVSSSCQVVTPFWPQNGQQQFKDNLGDVSILRFDDDERPDIPPFILVRDKRLALRFLLLVSSFYSGSVPLKIREIIDKIRNEPGSDKMIDLLREDKGELSNEYIEFIRTLVKPEHQTIAINHHNLCQYGTEICLNQNAKELLSALSEKEIQLVLHGHTHLSESRKTKRNPNPGEAYPIPCPTLCGKPMSGSTNGFMMHLIGPEQENRLITSVIFNINESKTFSLDSEHIDIRYRSTISKNKIKVAHLPRKIRVLK